MITLHASTAADCYVRLDEVEDDSASRYVPAYRVVLDNAHRLTVNDDDGKRVIDYMSRTYDGSFMGTMKAITRTLVVTNLGDGPAYGLPAYGDDTSSKTEIVLAHITYVEKLSAYEVKEAATYVDRGAANRVQ